MRNVYPECVIAVAETQLGYPEKDDASRLDDWSVKGTKNFTKYARDMDKLKFYNFEGEKPKQGSDYCTVFIAWCIKKAGGDIDNARLRYIMCVPEGVENLSAGANQWMGYFKKAGRFFQTPKPGDVIFISWVGNADDPDHVGLVTDVGSDLAAYTTEANRSNVVDQFVYPHGYYRVIGFGRPRYDEMSSEEVERLKTELSIANKKLQSIASIIEE